MTIPLRHTAPVALLALLGACAGPGQSASLPLGAGGSSGAPTQKLPLTVMAALDSGNQAMRADDYPRAIAQYRLATAGAPEHPAPWFGLYMAAKEDNNVALADSAMVVVRRLTADSSVLPAHKEVADAAMPPHGGPVMPKGHPATGKDGGPVVRP
jgi:hypothetical protein